MAATTGSVFQRRKINHRILIKESRRRQRKPAHHARLHWMILRPRQMMHPEAMPKDDIGVLDRPIVSRPSRQSIIAGRLVYELARGVALTRLIGRDPKLMLLEPSSLARWAIRMRKRLHRGTG